MTASIPKQHISACHLIDIITQIIVRTKDKFCILRQLVDYFLRITTRHNNISKRLDSCCGVDITDNLIAWMLILELLQVFSLTTVS